MKTKELIAVLDRLDNEFKTAFIKINQLALFFDEDKNHLRVSLNRQVKNGIIIRIARGLYYNPRAKNKPNNLLFNIACRLRDYRDFYLSLESVLSEEGVISQIPNRLTFISQSKSAVFHTPFGIIEFTKGNVDNILFSKDIYFDEYRGVYCANAQRAIKDAILHKRSVDLIIEQRQKDELY
ncbi:type IV toxin-antitoxin system AbiEi family antitoxin [Campylobacter devanensis]|uniref:type IV toxin-antitoxin system AbiEi family antitoxin n=1 Tax=Campylobacter devanensis TaxID=3161138 RepID=UPI000A34FB05|nr:hypothetical protein [Campylobacter sp. P0107]